MNPTPRPPPPVKSLPVSPADTLVDRDPFILDSVTKSYEDDEEPQFSTARRYVLLLVFCLAQFLDSFNNSALFSAIPTLVTDLGMTSAEQVWIISAFQLTFASFLLISGRISDVYSPKAAFITGIAGLGVLSIALGFVRNAILLLVLRAFSGISASLTIPSALTLLVNIFPDPTEQSRAIGVFGGSGAVANVLGLTIGAIIVEYASWPWVFWFVAIVASPLALGCIFLIPPTENIEYADVSQREKFRSLDLVGISVLTAALVLFIFAVTTGGTDGWATVIVLVPLIVAIVLVAAFLYWETLIPIHRAAVPPRTWFYPNFSVLFGVALLPYFWWTTSFTVFTSLWQDVFHWSVISTAIHMFPIGVLAFAMSFTGSLSRRINSKYIILCGLSLLVVATILLAFAGSPDRYWSFTFPAFVLGSAGAMLTFTHTNIAIFRTSPSTMAGTVGAIFNGALQLGSAVGIAAVSSITSSVQEKDDGPGEGTNPEDPDYAGRRSAFWFLLAVVCAELVSVTMLYKTKSWRGEEVVNVHLLEAGKGKLAMRRKAKEVRFGDVEVGRKFSVGDDEKMVGGYRVENGDREKDSIVEVEVMATAATASASVDGRIEESERKAYQAYIEDLDADVKEITTVEVYTSNII